MSRNPEIIEIFDSDDEIEEVSFTNNEDNEDVGTDQSPITLSMCRYFLRGECRYGNSCSYLHLDQQPPSLFSDCVFHNPLINCQNPANNFQNTMSNSQNPMNNCPNQMNNCPNQMNNPMNNFPTLDFSNASGVSSSTASPSGLDMSVPQPQRVNIILPPPPLQINVISSPNNGAQIQVINNINVAPQSLLMGRQSVDMLSPPGNSIPQTVTSSTAQSMNGAPNAIQFSSSGPYRLNVLAPIFVPTYQRYAPPDSMPTTSSQASFNNPDFIGFNPPTPAISSTSPPATYADVVNGSRPIQQPQPQTQPNRSLCPFAEICPNRKGCDFQHFDQCETCKIFCLHPFDMDSRREHYENCTWQQQLTARSKDKVCGICFDRIMEKPGKDRLFGLLPNCFHVFCLDCLRRWRRAEHFDREITRGCPECRISSNFVCPCPYWVENKEEKDKIIQCYKSVMSEKDCKYFKKGEGSCPFGNKCFYKHALPNGKKVDVGQPARHVRRVQTSNEEIMNLIDIYMWEFVDRRNQLYNAVNIIGDSDDSDAASEDIDLDC